jgi:tRNA(Ile)-lysidine synthetase-like protein
MVAPGARAALVRLARNAARDEAAWTAAEDLLLEGVLRERASGRFVLALPALLAYHPAIRLRLVRRLARELGVDLDEAGTRVAMEFTSRGASGGGVHLSGSLRLRRSFDDLELARTPDAPDVSTARVDDDAGIDVPGPGDGTGEFRLGGRRVRARWGPSPVPSAPPVPAMPTTPRFHQAAFDSRKLAFPLTLRGARPGDRMRLAYGRKTIAKLLAEARVPRWERRLTTVLADADGRVLWVPGWARSVTAVPAAGHGDFHIGVEDAHSE